MKNESPNTLTLPHILSGAGAGLVAALVTSPLDVVKIRMQAQSSKSAYFYFGLRDAVSQIYKSEGFRGYFVGLPPNLVALLPNWATYFTVYEQLKFHLDLNFAEFSSRDSTIHLLSALGGGTASCLVTAPFWIIRTRLITQLKGTTSFYYSGTFNAFYSILQTEGVKGLYKGLTASLLGVGHVGIQFPVYEKLKKWRLQQTESNFLSTSETLLFSSFSKVLASITWYPHEVIRTRLQTQHDYTRYKSIPHCVATIFREEGFITFYRGLATNLLRVTPVGAVTFSSYETLLYYLKNIC